jgi:putative DNA methylase
MPKKKLIEVGLPLEAINRESSREKSIRHGHPSTLHLWWSRKPLATARAVLFAQLVDDPSSRTDEFPTVEAQDAERRRLHSLIGELIVWENSRDEELLERARAEIRKSNGGILPSVADPFAGGGSIPLEAHRLGLETYAGDLNPVAVLLNAALIDFPARFTGQEPVGPLVDARTTPWIGSEGLAADVRSYGEWVSAEAFRRIGQHFPTVVAPGGTEHTVIAWKWARTVKSPNPANPIETPLVNSWWLSKRKGKETFVVPTLIDGEVRYRVVQDSAGPAQEGSIGRKGGSVIGDETPFTLNYVRQEGRAGRIGSHLIAVVAEGSRGRLYLDPTEAHVRAADVPHPEGVPEGDIGHYPRDIKTQTYGMTKWADLFTNRQLLALTTLGDLVGEVRERVLADALAAGRAPGNRLEDGGRDAEAYADAVATYLALAVSRMTDRYSNLCSWDSSRDSARNVFARQAIPMIWDFAEINPFSDSTGNYLGQVDWVAKVLEALPATTPGHVEQRDAAATDYRGMAISTDPPYYDYIGYSDLSDFFYVWLRRSLRTVQPRAVGTLLTPKSDELVANPHRHDGKDGAERFFVDGFNEVFRRMRATATDAVPLTLYYAYKQQDTGEDGQVSTGWHTLLNGLIATGWEITATWPMRSEMSNRPLSQEKNALASSIVLACRPRPANAPATTRRAFVAALKSELPEALRRLMQGAVAPVDLAQAAIGPGIGVFSRYSRVREADGSEMNVKDALLLINSTLDEVLGEQESDFDPDTRFAVKWYRQYGWTQESSGIADQLARSSDTSVGALERGGIFEAKGGKARLLSPLQLDGAWDPESDDRVSVWEATVRLAAVMDKDGGDKVAELLSGVQMKVNLDAVKELGFLLFHEAEKKHNTKDAILFNGLVSAWSDVTDQARKLESRPQRGTQQTFDFDDGDED